MDNITLRKTQTFDNSGNWTHNLQTAWCPEHLCAWDGHQSLHSAKGLQNPLQKSSWQQLLKGSTQCAAINTLDWKILLSQFFPWLQIGGHHADNSEDQEVHHTLTGEQGWAETFSPSDLKMDESLFTPRAQGQNICDTTGTSHQKWGGKRKFDTLLGNYISRSVVQEICLNYSSLSFNIK